MNGFYMIFIRVPALLFWVNCLHARCAALRRRAPHQDGVRRWCQQRATALEGWGNSVSATDAELSMPCRLE
eukprot:7334525-Alexandrium_andersonii.AAC.1